MLKNWLLITKNYRAEHHLGAAPINTLGNGFIGCRGFFEETQEGIAALGGIYMAGIFGKASYKPWKGEGHELVNTPNFFYVCLEVDNEIIVVNENTISDFSTCLNLKEGILTRSYTWLSKSGKKINFTFERFISYNVIHRAGQRLLITPVNCSPHIKLLMGINASVTNLNEVSSEPLPVQPGKKQLKVLHQDANTLKVEVLGTKPIQIAEGQSIHYKENTGYTSLEHYKGNTGEHFNYQAIQGETFEISKVVSIATSLECPKDPLEQVQSDLKTIPLYEEELLLHKKVWAKKWETSDIQLEGSDSDQIALRYNIFQLIQSCPEHDSRYSIGARGLTGEMYEGCVFWDTEIFMVPFFTMTNPSAASKLLHFRYHTLPEARAHASSNYFKGAMYGWQVNANGVEQTPQGVGAYYSIHVIADIAYAILDYWYATGDNAFMVQYGAEILIETARYWESRVHKDPTTDAYNILAVRGPNEYDVLVNNNLYTNMMARENLLLAINFINIMKSNYQDAWDTLQEKLDFDMAEISRWTDIMDKIKLPYDKDIDLYLEDDTYLHRVPLDMNFAKPTGKRIIDTTIPYEALPVYQVTKQADVLHVMKNLPWYFTSDQVNKAWDFYLPKTAFDSSLAYSMHALMAARLGHLDKAYHYFEASANLDIRDIQLNTISGLHFANFGGTWQAVVFGFAGIRIAPDHIEITPHLPEKWTTLTFRFYYQGTLLEASITHTSLAVNACSKIASPIHLHIGTEKRILTESENTLFTLLN